MALFNGLKETGKEVFAFNLLPPRSSEELESEAKISRNLVYSIALPGILLFIGILIYGINFLTVERTRQDWDAAVTTTRTTLLNPFTTLGQPRVLNGELTIRTEFIKEPIEKNVDFNTLFDVTEEVFDNYSRSQVTSYGRENDGAFIVNGITSRDADPSDILTDFKTDSRVISASLRSVSQPFDSNGEYRFTIEFELTNLVETNTTNAQ